MTKQQHRTIADVLRHGEFLVDTNVISHLIRSKREPDPGIRAFFESVDEDRLYLSVLTIGEIQRGIARLVPSLHDELERKLQVLCDRFETRIVSVDVAVARTWGRVRAEQEHLGRPTPVVDTLIASSAHARGLILATIDADFNAFERFLRVFNPITGTVRT